MSPTLTERTRLAVTVAGIALFKALDVTLTRILAACCPAGAALPSPGDLIGAAIGEVLSALIAGYILVEIVAAVVPRWRTLRTGGPAPRQQLRRAAWGIGVALSALAITLPAWLPLHINAALNLGLPWGIGDAHRPVLAGAVCASAAVAVIALATGLSRWGIGNGWSILSLTLALGQIISLGGASVTTVPPVHDLRNVFVWLVCCAAVVAMTLCLWRCRGPDAGHPSAMRASAGPVAPSSGIWPLEWSGAALLLPATVVNLGLPGADLAQAIYPGSLTYTTVRLVAVLILSPLLSWAFFRPGAITDLYAREGSLYGAVPAALRDDTHTINRSLWRAIGSTSLFFALVVALEYFATRTTSAPLPLHGLIIATAVLTDLQAEWRQRVRHGELVSIFEVHRLYEIPALRATLERIAVQIHVRGLRHRALLQFFGPYVPVEIMVAAADAPRARQALIAPTTVRSSEI